MIDTKYKYLIPVLVGAMLVAMTTPAFAYWEYSVQDVSTQANDGFYMQVNSGSPETHDFTFGDYAKWYNEFKNMDSTDSGIYIGTKAYYNRPGGSGGVLSSYGGINYGQTLPDPVNKEYYKSRVMITEEPASSGYSLSKLHYYANTGYVFDSPHVAGVTDPII